MSIIIMINYFFVHLQAKALEKVEGELAAVGDILKKMPNFAAYLENPTISRGDKVAKVGEVIDEKKFSHITRNLFMTLSANGRIGEASKVSDAYTYTLPPNLLDLNNYVSFLSVCYSRSSPRTTISCRPPGA